MEGQSSYALDLADQSYDWYRYAAIKARRFYRLSETIQILTSTAIPVSAVIMTTNTVVPAVLGATTVVVTGLRSVFHWHDDYLRFSEAREAVEAERRLFLTGSPPYDEADMREKNLATAITKIEQREMLAWKKVAAPRKRQK
jgi:hypothetical protein